MRELWFNLVNFTALKGIIWSMKDRGFWMWLYYELVPSWNIKYDGFFGPSMYQEAIKGWCGLHLSVAFTLAFLGVNVWQMALIAFGIEVFQFVRDKGAMLFPVNSLLDIGSYCLWVYLYREFIGWSVFS